MTTCLKNAFLNSTFIYKEHKINITFSAGVTFRNNYNSIVDAQTKADELLYEAKNKGRDKVIFDDGMEIKCTDNHKFKMKSGEYKELKDIRPGESVDVVTKYIPTGDNAKNSKNSRYYRYISLSHFSWLYVPSL